MINILYLAQNSQDFCLKVLDNKLAPFTAPVDMDAYKMSTIESEFNTYACQVLTRAVHFFALLWVRGAKFNLFDMLFLGKATAISLKKMLSDLHTYIEYRVFLMKLDNNMVLK